MASAYNIQLSATSTTGHTHVEGLSQETADKVSELLMLNHEKYHTFFNEVGLHNHIVHHLLSLFALGAGPSEIQAAYDLNAPYQLLKTAHEDLRPTNVSDTATFTRHLGRSRIYTTYLHFFQAEIAERGVETVVKEFLFKGDKRADDLLGRLYSGFEHPILHLGFALEFQQPCLVAEALASTCIHDNWPLDIVRPVEAHIASNPGQPQTSLFSVIHALRADPIISTAVHATDRPNRVTDGLLKRAYAQLPPILSPWRVQPTEEDIAYRTAEMAHMSMYVLGAAQNPSKVPGMDFFLMHSANLSVFYPAFMGLEWLSLEQRARLLAWKGWIDAAIYAACGCPALIPSRITDYTPKMPGSWPSIIARANAYADDGHTAKLIRAIINAETISKPYCEKGNADFPLLAGDFLQIAHMTMDSVERMNKPGYQLPEKVRKMYVERLGVDEEVVRVVCRWVRWCGVEGAWDDIPDLEQLEWDREKVRL
ncbi:hypothetical protein K504DRAFT_439131 [Pleomassaria siparia CBS 279.74]|uniref:HypA-like protein n=1 Tax=Pleomassaria siparia CBS 279.74 TaxID=1314801 RepID=A0A6G1JZ17_9PLEO|nr:hypothetical protein K504DRAFT_439131 [Pleomassaria siparia CBS 279.74]